MEDGIFIVLKKMTNANVKFDDARKRKLIEMLDADQLIQMLGIMREKGMTDLEELSDEYLSDATAKFDDEQDVLERKVMSETKDLTAYTDPSSPSRISNKAYFPVDFLPDRNSILCFSR